MDDPGGGGGGDIDVGDDVVAVVIRDESGQHIADAGVGGAGDGIGVEEDEVGSTLDDAVASGSNVIVDDSPLQNQMERNKECKFCCDVENILIHYSCGSSRSRH